MKTTIYLLVFIVLNFSSVNAQERILTAEEPPTNYRQNGKLIGTTVDIVKEIKRYLNLNVRIDLWPGARAIRTAKKHPNVVLFTLGRTQDRIDHGYHFIGPVITRNHLLWSKAGSSFNITGIQDIKNKKLILGATRGDWREKFFQDHGLKVQSVTNHELNVRKLLFGRIHLWVSSDIEAPPILDKLGYDMKQIEIAYIFKRSSSYITLSKGTPREMVEKWRDTFTKIQQTDFFDKASKKWSIILGYELQYAADTGFYAK